MEKNFYKNWIFRVHDGINFYNSNFSFWGVKKGKNGCIKNYS